MTAARLQLKQLETTMIVGPEPQPQATVLAQLALLQNRKCFSIFTD